MDKGRLAEMIGAAAGANFWVREIHLFNWGHELVLDCLYDAPTGGLSFQLTVRDCREMQWRVYAHLRHAEDRTLPATMLVNLRLGSAAHRKPLHLLTEAFGLTVLYGELVVQRVG
jgi:hypothetical protein